MTQGVCLGRWPPAKSVWHRQKRLKSSPLVQSRSTTLSFCLSSAISPLISLLSPSLLVSISLCLFITPSLFFWSAFLLSFVSSHYSCFISSVIIFNRPPHLLLSARASVPLDLSLCFSSRDRLKALSCFGSA